MRTVFLLVALSIPSAFCAEGMIDVTELLKRFEKLIPQTKKAGYAKLSQELGAELGKHLRGSRREAKYQLFAISRLTVLIDQDWVKVGNQEKVKIRLYVDKLKTIKFANPQERMYRNFSIAVMLDELGDLAGAVEFTRRAVEQAVLTKKKPSIKAMRERLKIIVKQVNSDPRVTFNGQLTVKVPGRRKRLDFSLKWKEAPEIEMVKTVKVEKIPGGSAFVLKGLPTGDYYIVVREIQKKELVGKVVPYQETVSVSVATEHGEVELKTKQKLTSQALAPKGIAVGEDAIEFRWSKCEGAVGYMLSVRAKDTQKANYFPKIDWAGVTKSEFSKLIYEGARVKIKVADLPMSKTNEYSWRVYVAYPDEKRPLDILKRGGAPCEFKR